MIDCLSQPMIGDGCRAELFSERYREQLRAACTEDQDVWQVYAWSYDPEHFDATLDGVTGDPTNQLFIVFDGEEFAGMSAFLRIDVSRQSLEIGNTYYRPHLRGTGINRRVKDMMLRRAFECDIRRVEFRTDRRNIRSQAALKKLGATREGLLRAERVTWTGHVRDTVLFAILKDEWPI